MTHKEELSLSAYLDGELGEQERRDVEAHLAACPACERELASLRFAKAALARAPRRAMPPELIASIEARVESRWSWLTDLAKPVVLVPAGVLAAAALVVSVWLNVSRSDPDQYVPLAPLLAAHSRYTAEGLVPSNNLVAGAYSRQLTDYYSNYSSTSSDDGSDPNQE